MEKQCGSLLAQMHKSIPCRLVTGSIFSRHPGGISTCVATSSGIRSVIVTMGCFAKVAVLASAIVQGAFAQGMCIMFRFE
jgi:hypothetical protein